MGAVVPSTVIAESCTSERSLEDLEAFLPRLTVPVEY
jgi:hypothetical protein